MTQVNLNVMSSFLSEWNLRWMKLKRFKKCSRAIQTNTKFLRALLKWMGPFDTPIIALGWGGFENLINSVPTSKWCVTSRYFVRCLNWGFFCQDCENLPTARLTALSLLFRYRSSKSVFCNKRNLPYRVAPNGELNGCHMWHCLLL